MTAHPNFVPPPTQIGQHRRRKRRIVIAVVVALALAVGGWAGISYLDRQEADNKKIAEERAKHCSGLDGTSGEGFALSKRALSKRALSKRALSKRALSKRALSKRIDKTGDKTGEQCVGWVVERDYPFGSKDRNVTSVISKITAENRRVRDQAGKANGKPYARVGVLMPMTSAPGSAMGADEILHALQGAYAEQIHANDERSSPELGDATPLIQLVLANEGLDQSSWPEVVDQLGRLRGGDHPLVAVTGLSISVPATRKAAERLSELEIPSIGAVITAEDMVAPWLFKVAPSNHQYALSLKAFLDKQPTVKTGYLVYDRNPEDNYVRSLATALTGTFNSTYALQEHSGGFNGSKPPLAGTPTLFSEIVHDVCQLNPDVLLYAGRDRDLPVLVRALKGRGHCQNPVRPLVIATGATGLTITKDDLDAAQLGVLDASATDPETWRTGAPGTPVYYAAFHTLFATAPDKGGLGFTEADLADGYAIMHRDAVATAVWAARRDAADKAASNAGRGNAVAISELPTSHDVHNAIFSLNVRRVPGASGAIYFREQPPNDRWPSGKPVPVIRIGALVSHWTSPATYVTE